MTTQTKQLELFKPNHPWWLRVIARLLWLANSDPHWVFRHHFYDMKEHILRKWGHACGYDIQEIEKECWSCDGTGGLWEPGGCWKCVDGIYERYWVYLERWALCGYVFHRPDYRVYDRPLTVDIKGYVRHKESGPKCREAAMWLALIFDRGLFRALLRNGQRGWYPMCLLSQVFAFVCNKLFWFRWRWNQRCFNCRRRLVWPWNWYDGSACSAKCDEVPF